MEKVSFNDIESKYSELAQLNNSKKSDVYLVQNMLDGRIYIKKELKNYNIDVYRQIRNIKNLFIARVYELFKCDDILVVIEEFINGQTLQHIVDNEGPLSEKIAVEYVLNLCAALDILHNQNPPIIHRDIKPSNVIIDNNGILKLIDFDVSRVYNDEKNMDTHILGTKGYASPEQFGFEQTDCRSDIYSVGVMLNVLTTGKHVKEKLNDGRLKDVIEKCTNISPDNRYSSVKELNQALNDILSNSEKVSKINKDVTLDLKKPDNINKEEVSKRIQKEPTENVNLNKEKINNLSNIKNKRGRLFSNLIDMPGYRTGNVLKIVGATFWYAFLVFGFTSNWGTGDMKLIKEDALTASLLFLLTLFNCNYKNIKNKLPVTRSGKRENKIAGTILYNIGIFMIYAFLL